MDEYVRIYLVVLLLFLTDPYSVLGVVWISNEMSIIIQSTQQAWKYTIDGKSSDLL